jgi:protein HIRA/HIR1
VYLYGTSPTSGWESGIAFRSHAPFVFGSPIVSLHLKDIEGKNNLEPQNSIPDVQIIVVTGDGNFGVYTIMPEPKLQYKGSLVPAIMHMRLASPKQTMQPKLVRMQITESKHLLAILSFQLVTPQQQNARGAQNRPTGTGGANTMASATSPFSGGSLQAFVYDRQMELWIRVSDSRFSLSDFYSSRPSLKAGTTAVLSQIDDSTRMEASAFSSRRGRDNITSSLYENGEERESSTSAVITRSHCEDRMACALALGSAFEFKHWLSLYVRQLTVEGNIAHLRFVVDMLIGSLLASSNTSAECDKKQAQYCWWLSSADSIFGLAKMDLVRDIVVPEMSKNRALQRLVNEIATEVKSLS